MFILCDLFFFSGLAEPESSFPQTNNLELISQSFPSEDAVVIVGKGITKPKLSLTSHNVVKLKEDVPL